MAGLQLLATTSLTLAGIELPHRIHKKQFMLDRKDRPIGRRSLKTQWAVGLARGTTEWRECHLALDQRCITSSGSVFESSPAASRRFNQPPGRIAPRCIAFSSSFASRYRLIAPSLSGPRAGATGPSSVAIDLRGILRARATRHGVDVIADAAVPRWAPCAATQDSRARECQFTWPIPP